MQKKTKKLRLSCESIQTLSPVALSRVAGGISRYECGRTVEYCPQTIGCGGTGMPESYGDCTNTTAADSVHHC